MEFYDGVRNTLEVLETGRIVSVEQFEAIARLCDRDEFTLSEEGLKEISSKLIGRIKAMIKKFLEWIKNVWNTLVEKVRQLCKKKKETLNGPNAPDTVELYSVYIRKLDAAAQVVDPLIALIDNPDVLKIEPSKFNDKLDEIKKPLVNVIVSDDDEQQKYSRNIVNQKLTKANEMVEKLDALLHKCENEIKRIDNQVASISVSAQEIDQNRLFDQMFNYTSIGMAARFVVSSIIGTVESIDAHINPIKIKTR